MLALGIARASAAGLEWAEMHIGSPRDTPYPGTIGIQVDASDTAQGIFRVHEIIPVRSGELTLLYPRGFPEITPRADPSTCWPGSP